MQKIIQALLFAVCALSFSINALAKSHYIDSEFDPVIANKEKLIDMLKRSGVIPINATTHEAELLLNQYLRERKEKSQRESLGESSNGQRVLNKQINLATTPMQQKKTLQRLTTQKHEKDGEPDDVQLETYTGSKRTAKLLLILIEFPDFPHNSILPENTGNYYPDFNVQHYQDLLFSRTGLKAPNGDPLISMLNYYEEQSGGSYSIEGTVAGWYMASQPAAYYGNNTNGSSRALVREALLATAADPTINLSDYDIEDRYDLDGDGDFWEPDGLIDHVLVIHSSMGEEAGGGQLGTDAIWSHRASLGQVFRLPNTNTGLPYWGGNMGAFTYTMQPEDSAVGVIAHEYAHDLGLPDEYDTGYTGLGEPVAYWSLMSVGSWAGIIPGSEPTGLSAYAKQSLQHLHGGNWLHGETYELQNLTTQEEIALLDQAVSKGLNNDAVRINLPQKKVIVTVPTSGEFAYFGGKANNLNHSMTMPLDLTTSTRIKAKFKTWYDIEKDWDYAYVAVNDGTNSTPLMGNITTTSNPNGNNWGHGITGSSGAWIDAEFDLSAYAGQFVTLEIYYQTDAFTVNPGFYIDDFTVVSNGNILIVDNADSIPLFTLTGFIQHPGYNLFDHYYLMEWRTHRGVDKGLAHPNIRGAIMPYSEGLLIWYVDNSYTNNWVGIHPGGGFLGVVDADQRINRWSDGTVASTRYQIHDAAFSLDEPEELELDLMHFNGLTLEDEKTKAYKKFKDSKDYSNPLQADSGKVLPVLGLKVKLLSQSEDKSVVKLSIGVDTINDDDD